MINIRPVTDLRYKYPEIETLVREEGPVYLTKNGYGSMVLMSLETYSALLSETEQALDAADRQAKQSSERLSHDEVFTAIRSKIHAAETI